MVDNPWLLENIRKHHGPLGEQYPHVAYLMEGDTPSFLRLIPTGLNSPEDPALGGWGGRYHYQVSLTGVDESRPIWSTADDTVVVGDSTYTNNQATIWRWRDAYQSDFASRMDWCVKPFEEANHPPVPNLVGSETISATYGSTIRLSADGTSDPDGDALLYSWELYKEEGSYTGNVTFSHPNAKDTTITFTDNQGPKTAHVILSVRDNGTPQLTRYKRVIIDLTSTYSGNTAPVGISQSANVPLKTPTLISLTGSDAEADPLSYSIVSKPSNGTLSGTAPTVTYTPKPGFITGADSFTFTVNDGYAESDTAATVSIIMVSNSPPVLESPSYASPSRITTTQTADLFAAPSDPEGNPLTYAWSKVSGPGTVTFGSPAVAKTTASFSEAGSYVLLVSVDDGVGGSDRPVTDKVTVTVTDSNLGDHLESGGVVSMEAENGKLGSRWTMGPDADASNNAFIEVDPAYGNSERAPEGTTAEHIVRYPFTISTSGNYRFWFRMMSDNGNDDSFFWRIDGGSWVLENDRNGIGSWFSRDSAQVDSLGIGSHVLEIAYRENGTRLDKFVIQLDSLTAPSDDGPAESNRSDDDTAPAAPGGTAGDCDMSLDCARTRGSDLASYTVDCSTTSGRGYASIASGVATSFRRAI